MPIESWGNATFNSLPTILLDGMCPPQGVGDPQCFLLFYGFTDSFSTSRRQTSHHQSRPIPETCGLLELCWPVSPLGSTRTETTTFPFQHQVCVTFLRPLVLFFPHCLLLIALVNELCHPTSSNRPSPSQIKNSPLFKNSPLLKLTATLDTLRLQPSEGRQEILR